MSRIQRSFKKLKKAGKKAFIPYIMAGDPSLEKTKEVVRLFEECGADIVELGVPFSDPLADGPTIQRASERALAQNVTLRTTISLVRELRHDTRVPIVIMTYFNPVFRYGTRDFISDAHDAGIDGVIIPDLPPDEAGDFIRQARSSSLDTIFLLAPTSTDDRIKRVARASSGFIYYVSMTGITGSTLHVDQSMKILISKIKNLSGKPVAVGFGVSNPDEASYISGLSDGVIVGSALVKKLHEAPEELRKFLVDLRTAIS
jgi:tryptophan synthase alpha chain